MTTAQAAVDDEPGKNPLTRPVRVTVTGSDGTTSERVLEIHPLAMTIPASKDEDYDRLRADIEAEGGINEELVIFEGKVLDGRHRLLIAGELGLPVRLHQFTGSREDARRYVWSANVVRRHMTTPQIALAALRHFGGPPPAAGGKTGKTTAPPRSATKRHKEISRRAGGPGVVTPATLMRFELGDIASAPETVALIESGVIRRPDEAVRAAARELNTDPPPPIRRTPYDRLGCAQGDIRSALTQVRGGSYPAGTEDRLWDRCNELQTMLFQVKQGLRARGFTPPAPAQRPMGVL